MEKFNVPDPNWLTDRLFENYMECFTKKHEYFDSEDSFMFSYKENSALEKIVNNLVKHSYIKSSVS